MLGEESRLRRRGLAIEAKAAMVQYHEPVGEREDFFQLVRNDDEGRPPGLEFAAEPRDILNRLEVKVGERFVEYEAAWLRGEYARDREPAFLAAGKRLWPPIPGSVEPGGSEGFLGPTRDFALIETEIGGGESDVFGDGLAQDLRVGILENVADGGAQRSFVVSEALAPKEYGARGRRGKPDEVPGKQGLARAVSAGYKDEFAIMYGKTQIGDARDAVAEDVAEALRSEEFRHRRPRREVVEWSR